MTLKVLQFGATGQVGQALAAAAGEAVDLTILSRADIDLTDLAAIRAAILAADCDLVWNAAAFTQVDKAEAEPETAFAVNAAAPGAMAAASAERGLPFVHLSTDSVFDGQTDRPYVETDPARPISVYGRSKLAGEQAVLATYPENSAVLRVAWVYSPFGGNFVKTMLRLAGDRDDLGVVGDQVGNPTSALAIADGILQVATNMVSGSYPDQRGIFHMTAQGEGSWADFAQAIFAASTARGGPSASVRNIGTADYPTPATRPANSRLDCARIAKVHGVTLPDWRTSLDEVMDRLQPAEQ